MKSVMRIGDFSFSFLDRGRSPNCQWANFLKMHITYLIHIQNVQERNKIFSNRTNKPDKLPGSGPAATTKYPSPIRPSASTPVFGGLEKSADKVSSNVEQITSF